MDATPRSAGEMPDQKCVDIAKQQIAGLSLRSRPRNLFKYPPQLEATEISSERKPGPCAIAILSAERRKLVNSGSHSRVLPHNRVANRLPTLLVPDHGCFPLVGDPDRRQIF